MLCGLKQASQAWYMKFHTCIQQMGFQQYPYDASLIFCHQGNDILIVDYIIINNNSTIQIQMFLSHLSSVFHMKDLKDPHYFLGIQVHHDDIDLAPTQSQYLFFIPQHFGLDGRGGQQGLAPTWAGCGPIHW